MVRKMLSLAVMAAVLATGAAGAQEKAKKLYRWVDKDGKIHVAILDDAKAVE